MRVLRLLRGGGNLSRPPWTARWTRTLRSERLAELGELQDAITARRRDMLVGRRVEVLVDEPGVGRTHREAPEIDGIVHVPAGLAAGTFAEVTVIAAAGCDLGGGVSSPGGAEAPDAGQPASSRPIS